jgi:hypothetical protein
MTTRIKLRRDTAANWTENNPILAAGEPGLETNTGKTKYGDGTTAWNSLGYATGGITAREQVGFFMTHGAVPNDDGTSWWFDGVETDPSGNAYYMGGYDNSNTGDEWGRVVKVNSLGEVQWQKDLTWADGWEGAAVSAAYNTATDQLVVVAGMFDYDDEDDLGAAVITLNADTGAIVGDPVYISDDVESDGSNIGGIDPSDIILDNDGNPIVVGHTYGAVTTYALTTTKVGVYNSIFVNPAAFTDKTPFPYNDWYITGTNITYEANVVDVNYYENQPAVAVVPTSGSGAGFTISSDGAGGYVIDTITDTGSGYYQNNKIKVLGTSLGGATPDNDANITITGTVGEGGADTATISGLSTGTAQFTGVTGTNIVSGSDATFNSRWRLNNNRQIYFPDYPETFGASWYQQGSGFAVGDTLYLNPDQYGGSTSATITVTTVGGSGEISDFTFTGTFNTSTIKLTVSDGIDFTTTGSWTASNYSTEAFIWTPEWAKTFGENEFDKVNAVTKDSEGNIYLACTSYDETFESEWGDGYPMPMLVKLDSAGNKQWAKRFAFDILPWSDGGYTGVAVDSNDDIIVAEGNVITKVDSDGTVIWQKIIAPGDPMGMWNVCVDIDSDDNIYLAGEYDYMGQNTGDDFLIIKFDTDGNVLWQREAGTILEEDSNWNNGFQILSVANDRVNIVGNFSVDEGDSVALAMSFSTDGSGAEDTRTGNFLLRTKDWEVTATTATVYNYSSVIVRPTQVTVTTGTSITATTSTTTNYSQGIRVGDTDGRIENLYSVSFEDGTVQTTAYTGALIREENRVYNTNDFYPNLVHANKLMRWDSDGDYSSIDIYIPHNDDVAFPIGTQMHFVKERGINSFMFWTYGDIGNTDDMRIIPSSPAEGMEGFVYNTGEGWSVRHPDYTQVPARATLTKTDTNTWLLECSSTSHIMDWSW